MKILLLAGEESGVLYADRLKRLLANDEVRGYGDYGFQTGDLAVFGIWEVLKRIGFFLRVKRTMEKAIVEWKPDVVMTIDYPGLNLKLAAFAKRHGIRAVHVVCPQVWAWRQGRIPRIEASLDKLCCFFPFEPAVFRPGFAEFVGHPLVEEWHAKYGEGPAADAGAERLVAILPGSRAGEVNRMLPTLVEAARRIEGARFEIPAANEKVLAIIRRLVPADLGDRVTVRLGGARELLRRARCAAVASGTATLEAALAGCPTVLVYKVSPILACILRVIIRGTKYAGLANIIWDRCRPAAERAAGAMPPMPELLQQDFTVEGVTRWLRLWLDDPQARAAATAELGRAMAYLACDGSAEERLVKALH